MINDFPSSPVPHRAGRGPQPPRQEYTPLGSALGLLAAGAFVLFFAQRESAVSILQIALTVLGILAVFFGLLLAGAGVGGLLNRSKNRHD